MGAGRALLCTRVQQRLAPRQAVASHAHRAIVPAEQLRRKHRHQRRGVVQEDAVQAHGAHVVRRVKLADGPAVGAEATCRVPAASGMRLDVCCRCRVRTTGVAQRVQLRAAQD